MTKQVNWNEIFYTEFSRLAMLSPLEREVLRMRIMGYSITQTSMDLNISESAVHRMIGKMKIKYDDVQPYSDVLPKRRKSKTEEWQDTH